MSSVHVDSGRSLFAFLLGVFVVQCGSSKVVYVGQIPSSKYSDDAILKLAEPFGRVRKYFLNRLKREVHNQNQDQAESSTCL